MYMYATFDLLQNEKFSSVKERVQKMLDVPEKEFEKVKSLHQF